MKLISASGESKTVLMHLHTLHELHRQHMRKQLKILRICPEKDVLLENSSVYCNGKKGKFDFLVALAGGKFMGMEVLSRPSKGKLKEKLLYADQVDEFVFVLPHNCLEFYRKPKKKVFHKNSRPKFFEKTFNRKNLFVWLLDVKAGRFGEKSLFAKAFNVEK